MCRAGVVQEPVPDQHFRESLACDNDIDRGRRMVGLRNGMGWDRSKVGSRKKALDGDFCVYMLI